MAPFVEPVASDETLPKRTDVVVVGGGIIGCSAALYLARAGHSVVLCEKGRIAAEQSSRNWGWCRQQGRDPREIPLVRESLRLWRTMHESVDADVGFHEGGVIYLCETDEDTEANEKWLTAASPFGLDSRMISAQELSRIIPGNPSGWKGALLTPSDGRAEPAKAAPAIARAARRAGATILTGCAVRALDVSGGKVSGVVTEQGRVEADAVILAGGAWSRLLLRHHSVTLPQLKVLASVMRTSPVEGFTECAFAGSGYALRKRQDGGYTVAPGMESVADIVPDSFRFLRPFLPLFRTERKKTRLRVGRRFLDELFLERNWDPGRTSPFEKTRVLDPEPYRPALDRTFDRLRDELSQFARVNIEERWAGLIDVTPDVVPVISPVGKLPGLVVATGFSGHGFGIGPAAGQLAGELATGAKPLVDPEPFRFERFSDGSPIDFFGNVVGADT